MVQAMAQAAWIGFGIRTCSHLLATILHLKGNSWPAMRPWQKLNTWLWDTKGLCDANCSLGTWCYLIYWIINWTQVAEFIVKWKGVYTGVAWADIEGTSKLHGQISSVPASTLLCHLFFFFNFSMSSWSFNREGKPWAWFISGVQHIQLEAYSLWIMPLSIMRWSWKIGMKRNSPCGHEGELAWGIDLYLCIVPSRGANNLKRISEIRKSVGEVIHMDSQSGPRMWKYLWTT